MSGNYLSRRLMPSYAAPPQNKLRLSPGDGLTGLHSCPSWLESMRTVAAVIALVACVHAGFGPWRAITSAAPDFDGQLASVSYAPFQRQRQSGRRLRRRRPRKFAPT